jgi:hypothetical protein
VHQVGHCPELHQDARSTKHKKLLRIVDSANFWIKYYINSTLFIKSGTLNIGHTAQAIYPYLRIFPSAKTVLGHTVLLYPSPESFTWLLYRQGATAPRGPGPPHYRGFTITLRPTTLSRTLLDEWSAPRRDLYLTTHNTHKRQISIPPAGFEPAIPAAADPRIRPWGHWDRLSHDIQKGNAVWNNSVLRTAH